MIIGAYSLLWGIVPFSLEIDQTFIGAILTAIGYSINDNVPITTPKIIANAKLRIESPPRMKIHSNTINVLNDVLIVRASVVFNESLNN